ncbi:MAG: hypothetical protein EBT46_02425 [Actinobacteria bacterium]|nr:hypothetical protein [Actinomycetota bacterium]NBR92345.1 hypothetical protein [Actinomycetota bacterium]
MGFHSHGVKRRALAVAVFLSFIALGCAETPRTATNFCRVLADRIDEMTSPPTSNGEVERLVEHYERLAEVAPLEVEADFIALRDVFVAASEVNVGDTESVQALADAAYLAETSADRAAMYAAATCGVDLSTGFAVQVPTLTPETVATTLP